MTYFSHILGIVSFSSMIDLVNIMNANISGASGDNWFYSNWVSLRQRQLHFFLDKQSPFSCYERLPCHSWEVELHRFRIMGKCLFHFFSCWSSWMRSLSLTSYRKACDYLQTCTVRNRYLRQFQLQSPTQYLNSFSHGAYYTSLR